MRVLRMRRLIEIVSTICARTFPGRGTSGKPGRKPSAAFATTISCAWCAKIRCAKDCCTRERRRAFTFRLMTASTGKRCGSICRWYPSTIWRLSRMTWWPRRMADRSGFSTTSPRCARWMRMRELRARISLRRERRFVWNLRYPDPRAMHPQSPYNYPIAAIVGETPLPPQGPLVLPGKYEVRLKAGEQVFREPLEVKMDPRVVVARNELQSSLELQLKIAALLEKNFDGYQQTKQLRARLAELIKRSKEDPIVAAAKLLDAKAENLEGEATSGLETPKATTFMAVNDTLTALMALVDGADFAPSEESFAAYRRICKRLNETLSAWQGLKNKDVSALNGLLVKSNLAVLLDAPGIPADAPCGN